MSWSVVRRLVLFAAASMALATLAPVPASSVLAAQAQDGEGIAALSFTDVTAAVGMGSTVTGSHGAFWADATGDGRPDLFLSYNECRSGLRANRFYRNLGGTFVEEAGPRGLRYFTGGTHGGAFADLDNDGDFDLATGETYATDCIFSDPPALPNRLFRNDSGMFIDVTPPDMAAYPPLGSVGEGYTRSILGFDPDRDGDLDIFAVNGDRGSVEPFPDRNELYRNEGGFNFTGITGGPLVTTPAGQAGADTDYDGDGDVDIIVPNFSGPLGIIRNDGGEIFTTVPPHTIGIVHQASSGISSGDLNGDGRTDLVLIDSDRDPLRPLGFDRNAFVYLNTGGGTFTYHWGIPSGYFGGFTAGLADLDNDGDLDLTLPGLPFVLLNDGQANFSVGPSYPTPTPAPGCVGSQCQRPDPRTVAFADIDDDGDLDSVVTTKFDVFFMIRNNFNSGNWLKVQLTSPQGQAGAYGAKVRIFRAGTNSLVAFREAKNVYGYLSQDDPVMHVGLGSAATVDVEVTYLDGTRITRHGVGANQKIAFVGSTVLASPGPPSGLAAQVTGSIVALSWGAPASGAPLTEYLIEAGSAPGLANLAVLSTGLAQSLTVGAPDGVYYVRVRARNAVGVGQPSNEIVVSVPGGCPVPPAPVNLGFTVAGSLVTVTWAAPQGGSAPEAYIIEVGSQSGAANLGTFDTGSPILAVAAHVSPGTYFVRIRSRNACGVGPASNELAIPVG